MDDDCVSFSAFHHSLSSYHCAVGYCHQCFRSCSKWHCCVAVTPAVAVVAAVPVQAVADAFADTAAGKAGGGVGASHGMAVQWNRSSWLHNGRRPLGTNLTNK